MLPVHKVRDVEVRQKGALRVRGAALRQSLERLVAPASFHVLFHILHPSGAHASEAAAGPQLGPRVLFVFCYLLPLAQVLLVDKKMKVGVRPRKQGTREEDFVAFVLGNVDRAAPRSMALFCRVWVPGRNQEKDPQ